MQHSTLTDSVFGYPAGTYRINFLINPPANPPTDQGLSSFSLIGSSNTCLFVFEGESDERTQAGNIGPLHQGLVEHRSMLVDEIFLLLLETMLLKPSADTIPTNNQGLGIEGETDGWKMFQELLEDTLLLF